MFNVTEEIKKLSKYVINRTAVFSLASVLALTTSACGNSKKNDNTILCGSYVGLVDKEVRLLEFIEMDKFKKADEHLHSHYRDLISSGQYVEKGKNCELWDCIEKDIEILDSLTNYLTDEEYMKAQTIGLTDQELVNIYDRIRDEYENTNGNKKENDNHEVYGNTPISDIAEGIDAENILVSVEVNGKDEVINNHIMLYIDNYFNGLPGFFDLFDTTFQAFPCYKSGKVLTEEEKNTKLSNMNGQLFSYPILINSFLEEKGLSYFSKDKFNFTELEKIEVLLNNKEVTKYNSDSVFVFIPNKADLKITENQFDEEIDKYYVVIQKEDIGYDAEFECASTDVRAWGRLYKLSDGVTTRFQIHAKNSLLEFNGFASEDSFVSINDFLKSNGLEEYTKYDYSMGELIDINSYINMSNKVLKK